MLYHDILRLEIAVHVPAVVQRFDPVEQLDAYVYDRVQREFVLILLDAEGVQVVVEFVHRDEVDVGFFAVAVVY